MPSKLNQKDKFEYIVTALNFKDECFGYIIYDVQTLTCFIYETLSVQIGGAIKGAHLTNELYGYATQLEAKVKDRTLELEIAKKRIEEANVKLKNLDLLKNDFIANITHDFRSPLTAILNIADLALRFDKNIDDQNKENYSLIYRSSLIDNMKFIEETLHIDNLKNIYEIKNVKDADWDKIKNYKFEISKILLKMTEMALDKAKQTNCEKCKFCSVKSQIFIDNKCPNCGNKDLVWGRNKVVAFEST